MNNADFVNTFGMAKAFGVSPRTIRRWMVVGRIPKPIKLAPNQAFWTKDTVDELLRNLRNNGK